MSRARRYATTLVAATSLVAFILLVTGWGAAAAASISKVIISNTASHPVPVVQHGTASVNVANSPTVTIAGTPSVQVVSTPFQEFMSAESSGSEECQDITPPAGTTLTILSFNADVTSEAANRVPDVYLVTHVQEQNGGINVRSLRLNLQQESSNEWTGDVRTTMYTGNANDPSGDTFSYSACISPYDSSGPFSAYFTGLVSGTVS